MQIAHGAPGAIAPVVAFGLVTDRRTRVRIDRYVDRDLAQELAVAIEHLDAPVASVRHVDAVLRVHRNAMRSVELARAVTRLAP